MFTGIITELGTVQKVLATENGKTFVIQANDILKNRKIGDSISVNGACVTVTKLDKDNFQFDAIKETLEKTNLKSLKENNEVNLESAMILGQTLDGHLVQGHVDTTGIVKNFTKNNEDATLTIKFPLTVAQHLAFKGSICINGVSLTISNLQEDSFTVKLIPHTLEKTNLKNLQNGDEVNLEVDLISRYLERLLDSRAGEAKYEFLKERNLI